MLFLLFILHQKYRVSPFLLERGTCIKNIYIFKKHSPGKFQQASVKQTVAKRTFSRWKINTVQQVKTQLF